MLRSVSRLVLCFACFAASTAWAGTETASTPSTTTLTPSPTTAYTSAPNSSVTLTAVVTSGATGTVTFKDGSTSLSCDGSNPAALSGSMATCATTFSGEGIHVLSAIYSGDATFIGSSGTANAFVQKHATNFETTYCNAGAISNDGHSDLAYSHTVPYPSVIFVGDGVNTDITTAVSTISVTLKSFTSAASNDVGFLLVAPDGTHAYEFWKRAGTSAPIPGNYAIVDGSVQLPSSGTLFAGTYGPSAYGSPPDSYTPGPPVPAPHVPATFSVAAPEGSVTFTTAFNGAAAHGAWSLFLHNAGGDGSATSVSSGWCLDITPAAKSASNTTLATACPTTFVVSQLFTIRAMVTGNGPTGTSAFFDGDNLIPGCTSLPLSAGAADCATSSLAVGHHDLSADYFGDAANFPSSSGSLLVTVLDPDDSIFLDSFESTVSGCPVN
ncbi:MAG TPA: Ig-like domain-containing protein [Rudaea sp.]